MRGSALCSTILSTWPLTNACKPSNYTQLAIATLPRHAAVLANRCLVHAIAGRPGAAYADVSRIRYCRAKHFSRHYEHMRAALEKGNIIDALASFEIGA